VTPTEERILARFELGDPGSSRSSAAPDDRAVPRSAAATRRPAAGPRSQAAVVNVNTMPYDPFEGCCHPVPMCVPLCPPIPPPIMVPVAH